MHMMQLQRMEQLLKQVLHLLLQGEMRLIVRLFGRLKLQKL
ncbi:Uncharacterised protein [Neisseria flavescens]|nr:Uncharacterised protein [Neisseria meningitidis]STZ64742.1 Uncharacterised protein [Neisseria flavescens]SPY04324.1 Uncharacterised protein [Neisseria meningitidis]SPY05625.1 Uncharacterised protein [Neisseria meningitidis]SPY05864.1 Uncharacterised protein [Neisseria meningitidis]